MRASYITHDSQTMFLTIWHLTPFRDMTWDPIGQAGATPWNMGFGDRDHGASLSLDQQLMYYQNHPTTYVDLSGDPSDDDVVAWAGTDPRISIGGEGDIVYPSYAPPNPIGLEASLQDYTTYGLTDHNVNVTVKEKNAKGGAVSEGLIDNTTDSKQDSSEFGATFYEFARVYEYAPAKLASDVFPTTYSVSFESSLAKDNVIGEIAGPLIEQDNVNELDRVEVGTYLGQLAPDFTLSDAGGRSVTLSELRGRDILLVFWDIRCPYCAAKIPLLNEVEEGGLKVVSIALGATAAQVTKYIEDWNVKFD
ncbi:MAG: TlpA family protein disulfide reductase, partial [Planctomycetota bacterium]